MRAEMKEKCTVSQRGSTYYLINRNDQQYTLVFLPGLSANHHLFDSQTEYFKDRYSVIVWDAPAHGKSRPYRDFTYAAAAEELKTILEKEGIKQVVLIGQSAGGFTAQSFYKKYPETVRGMMMIGSCPYEPSYYSRSDLFWLRQTKWMFRLFPDGILRKSMARMCGSTAHARNNMMNMLEDYSYDELCRLLYTGFAGFIPEISAMNITCPVWLLTGEHDKTGKVMRYNRQWHEREGYPLHIIKGASHNANDDQPETVNELIGQFLNTLD